VTLRLLAVGLHCARWRLLQDLRVQSILMILRLHLGRWFAGMLVAGGESSFFKANNFNDFDVVPWPKNKVQKTVFGADGWGISTKTKQKAIGWELIKELTAVESQQQAAGLGVAIPARRSVAESKEFLAQPEHAALFYKSLSYAAPVQAPANYAEVERILMQHLSQVMADEVKPEEALKAANEELSGAMQQQAAEGQ